MSHKKDVRELIGQAVAVGWVYEGIDGAGHHRLVWPPTGRWVVIPASPSSVRSLPGKRSKLQRECGFRITPSPQARRKKAVA